jgi:hypothetical protein
MRQAVELALQFAGRYCADPYWPEREEVINIQKMSGMNRARSESKRTDALREYLKRIGLSMEDYQTLEEQASRPWYRVDDLEKGEIIIPSHQLYGCLIEAAKACPAGIRPCEPTNIRSLLQLSDLRTGKQESDGIYRRLVMPKSGTGQPLSNQRALRTNPFIEDFTATGTLLYFSEELRDEGRTLQDFFVYAGQRIGVGASRKMGFGRFTVVAWKER